VPNEHDDPAWSPGVEDDSLDKTYLVLREDPATQGRHLFSWKVAPYFYALSENYGSPEEDYLLAYEEGRLTQAAKQIYATLLEKGSLGHDLLAQEARCECKESVCQTGPLEDLQRDFKILR